MKTREAYNVIVKRIEAKTRFNMAQNCGFAFILVANLIFFSLLLGH